MTGMHALEAGHDVQRRRNLLAADGRIAKFMEQTDFYTMRSRDDLAAGSTRWVLARPGHSYIAYTYDCSQTMGIKDLAAGTYNLHWFDTVTGKWVHHEGVDVPSGDAEWKKPESLGKEIALYLHRQG